MNDYIREQLEQVFVVHEEAHELEAWTDMGYNIIITVEDWGLPEVANEIRSIDPNEVVYMWWPDESYRDNFGHDMRNALNDLYAWKEKALGILGY